MASLDVIRAALAGSPARRVKAGVDVWDLSVGPWWKLFTDYEGLERAKRRILEAAWGLSCPLFLVPPEPVAADLEPFLVRDESGAWRVRRDRPADDFYRTELEDGNWILYAAPQPASRPLPSVFKTAPEAVLDFMATDRITLLIDSFYDDTEWRVAVAGN